MLQLRRWWYAGLILSVLFIQACRQEAAKDIPDVSDIEVEMNVTRFEKALFSSIPTKWPPGCRISKQNTSFQ
ncbi:MAG: hypothetical protein IPN33_07300 [Saprospiraceae bacterium]|nr:hypothetical protein [Saprospiraceae bacterium]